MCSRWPTPLPGHASLKTAQRAPASLLHCSCPLFLLYQRFIEDLGATSGCKVSSPHCNPSPFTRPSVIPSAPHRSSLPLASRTTPLPLGLFYLVAILATPITILASPSSIYSTPASSDSSSPSTSAIIASHTHNHETILMLAPGASVYMNEQCPVRYRRPGGGEHSHPLERQFPPLWSFMDDSSFDLSPYSPSSM